MPSELLFEHLNPRPADNCFVDVACTASDNLWRTDFNPNLLHRILKPYPNEYHFRRLIKLLNKFGVVAGNFEVIEIPDNKRLHQSTLTAAISGGALCLLTVKAKEWVHQIRKKTADKIDAGEIHAILVYGYYRPNEVGQNTWFYIYDSYDGEKIFLGNEWLFRANYRLDDEISIGLLGLSLDFANLLGKYPAKDYLSDIPLREKIESTLPGRALKSKLTSLFSKKSTSRPQN